MLEALGSALQLPSTPRFKQAVDAVEMYGAERGSEPSRPHRAPLEEALDGCSRDQDELVLQRSIGDAAAARRAQASAENKIVASTLNAIQTTAAEVDLWGAALSDMQVSVIADALLARRAGIRLVDLSRNTIGTEALASLEYLLALGDVHELRLSGNGIGDAALSRICCALIARRKLPQMLAQQVRIPPHLHPPHTTTHLPSSYSVCVLSAHTRRWRSFPSRQTACQTQVADTSTRKVLAFLVQKH